MLQQYDMPCTVRIRASRALGRACVVGDWDSMDKCTPEHCLELYMVVKVIIKLLKQCLLLPIYDVATLHVNGLTNLMQLRSQ